MLNVWPASRVWVSAPEMWTLELCALIYLSHTPITYTYVCAHLFRYILLSYILSVVRLSRIASPQVMSHLSLAYNSTDPAAGCVLSFYPIYEGGGGTYSVILYLDLFIRDSLLVLVISCDHVIWPITCMLCDLISKYTCEVGWFFSDNCVSTNYPL